MIKQLTESEYEMLQETYNVTYFMGGFFGLNKSATIYLVNNEIWLVSNEETEKLRELQRRQLLEATLNRQVLEM